MKRSKIMPLIAIHLVVLTAAVGMADRSAEAAVYSCIPTCSETDARFLVLIGTSAQSLAGSGISLAINAPSTATSLQLGIFDGDTGGMWDGGTTSLRYTLYADPIGDGSGTAMVGQWLGNGGNGTSGSGTGGSWTATSSTPNMPDNAWWTLTVFTSAAARAANGEYRYTLKVDTLTPNTDFDSNFKLRTLAPATIAIGPQTALFLFQAPYDTDADLGVIYPNYPNSLTPTTYDGTWTFYFNVTAPQTSITIWDADFDFGSWDCTVLDTDDPDTPGAPFLPPWAVAGVARPEGVAVGQLGKNGCQSTGAPWDDDNSPSDAIWLRPPSVQYELIDPNGVHYVNSDPSGNLEWEQFRVSTAPFNRNLMDYHATSLPEGMYTVHITGLDLANVVAFRFMAPAMGEQCDTATGVCGPPPPVFPPTNLPPPNSLCGCKHYHYYHSDDDHSSECDDDEHDYYKSSTSYSSGGYSSGGYSSGSYSTSSYSTSTYSSGTYSSGSYSGGGTWGADDDDCEEGYNWTSKAGPGVWTPSKWAYYSSKWPVTQITIGGVTYTKAQALTILNTSSTNLSYALAKELIAAQLNALAGNDESCVEAAMNEANAWLILNPLGSSASPDPAVLDTLKKYNMGYLCAPARSWS